MTLEQILWANAAFVVLSVAVLTHCNWQKIRECFGMWFTRAYWTDFNTVEFASWFAKAIIIVPGLIFGISLWWLYFLTLATSLSLIWASNRKLLPTLVGFNLIWTWISCMVLAQNLIK